jgi:hypothetical protein
MQYLFHLGFIRSFLVCSEDVFGAHDSKRVQSRNFHAHIRLPYRLLLRRNFWGIMIVYTWKYFVFPHGENVLLTRPRFRSTTSSSGQSTTSSSEIDHAQSVSVYEESISKNNSTNYSIVYRKQAIYYDLVSLGVTPSVS